MSTEPKLHYIDCTSETNAMGHSVHAEGEHAVIVYPQFNKPPLRIECSLHISGNRQGLRLLYAAGQAMFGEDDSETLCWIDPCTGAYERVASMGALPESDVTIVLELDPDQARLSVNGETRLSMPGSYKGLSGQVGIGIPPGTTVTLRSLVVTGEAATIGHTIQKPEPIGYDGGLIDVLYDHHPQVLAWYEEHMGLKCNTWPGPSDRHADATLFSTAVLPDRGQFHLYSVLTRKRLAHWFSERGTVEGHVRFCFYSPDLTRTHAYFKEQGIRVSEMTTGPDGVACFDFYAPEGTRLTAVACPDKADAYPDARFSNFAPYRIGVTNLSRSVQWYQDMLGLTVEEGEPASGAVRMTGYLWLESVPVDQHVGQVDSAARVYMVCRSRQQFTELRERLRVAGARPSDYMNEPGTRWSAFHFYDPDGNRLNVWSYY